MLNKLQMGLCIHQARYIECLLRPVMALWHCPPTRKLYSDGKRVCQDFSRRCSEHRAERCKSNADITCSRYQGKYPRLPARHQSGKRCFPRQFHFLVFSTGEVAKRVEPTYSTGTVCPLQPSLQSIYRPIQSCTCV